MSDPRLRELERRWRETGSPDDEAAYLLERVRVGDLARERLELAASCGHEGARRAVGHDPRLPHSTAMGLEGHAIELVRLQARVDHAVLIRVLLALAEACRGRWTAAHPDDRAVAQAIARCRAWLECPCETCAARSRTAALLADDAALADEEDPRTDGAWMAAQVAIAAASLPPPTESSEALAWTIRYGLTLVGGERVQAAVASALSAWALARAPRAGSDGSDLRDDGGGLWHPARRP